MAIKKEIGAYSAYAIAKKHGFDGTEEEWLASLVGPRGAQGASVTGVKIDSNEHIIVTIHDPATNTDTTIDAGLIDNTSAVQSIQQAAQAAITQVTQAQTAGVNAVNSARDTALQQVQASTEAAQTASTTATEAASAADSSATAANQSKTDAESAKTAAASSASAAAESATSAQTHATTAQQAAETATSAAETAADAVSEQLKEDVQGIVDNLDGLSEAIAIKETATGEVISVSDSADYRLLGLKLYGKSVQDGTPTPEAPVEIESAGDSGNITVTLSDGAEQSQTLTYPTPNGLPGIPVESGGNYTDAEGQQWICDEVDFGRGKYIQRVRIRAVESGDSGAIGTNSTEELNRCYINVPGKLLKNVGVRCNLFAYSKDYIYNNIPENYIIDEGFSTNVLFAVAKSYGSTFEEIRQKLIDAGAKILYVLATPLEINLSSEQLAVYAALRSYKTCTIITTDSDPAAGISVDYVADTKTYIDNKIVAISEAIMGGNT